MGGAGKQLLGGGARHKFNTPAAQVSDQGYGRPPHPLRVLPGQIWFPARTNGRRRRWEITRVDGQTAHARRQEPPERQQILSVDRLLAVNPDGSGKHYTFQGYRSKGYRTWAQLVDHDDKQAIVILPEWHPARPVRLSVRALPPNVENTGAWMLVSADLSAPRPSLLNLTPKRACPAPATSECVTPTWQPAPAKVNRPVATYGARCGDIVLEHHPQPLVQTNGCLAFFVPQRPEGVGPRSRLYVPDDHQIYGYYQLAGVQPGPHGAGLIAEPRLIELFQRIPMQGTLVAGTWRWRWWPREAEGDPALISAYPYNAHLHRGGYVLCREVQTLPPHEPR